MLSNMSIYIGHMWNAVSTFIVQNPVIFGLGVAAIVVTTIFGLYGESWCERLERKMQRKEREIQIPSDIEF